MERFKSFIDYSLITIEAIIGFFLLNLIKGNIDEATQILPMFQNILFWVIIGIIAHIVITGLRHLVAGKI